MRSTSVIAISAVMILANHAHAANVSAAEAVKRGKEAVSRDFKDPLSVQWKNVYLNHRPDGQYVVCGSLNAKNSYGAYVGFRAFYVTVSMEKDFYAAVMSDLERMQKNAETNLANVGKGLPKASDVRIDPGDSRTFFEENQKMCVDGKRTYVK